MWTPSQQSHLDELEFRITTIEKDSPEYTVERAKLVSLRNERSKYVCEWGGEHDWSSRCTVVACHQCGQIK